MNAHPVQPEFCHSPGCQYDGDWQYRMGFNFRICPGLQVLPGGVDIRNIDKMVFLTADVLPGQSFSFDLDYALVDWRLRKSSLHGYRSRVLLADLEFIRILILLTPIRTWDWSGLWTGDKPVMDVSILKLIYKIINTHEMLALLLMCSYG